MARRIREFDWTATPLGLVTGWSERLKVLVEQALASPLVSTLVCGPQHILIYNDAAARTFGDRHPEALGHSLPETFPEGWATVSPYYARAFTGETVQVRGQTLDTRGEGAATDMFDALLAPVRESDGSFAYVHMTGAEVSNRAQIEALLRESETRHRLLVETWAQAVWETDPRGVVIADSPSWRAYTGQTLPEWLGDGWLDAVHAEDRAYAERQWREAIAAQRLVHAEFRLRAPDGGWRWSSVRAAPVLDKEGNIEKWAGLNIDIEARKQAEAALRASEEKYRSLFGSMDEAYAVVEVLRDGAGRWADFRFLDANHAFLKHTSMPYPVGKTATELLGSPNPRWTELYGQALDTGEPLRIEETEPTLGRTFDLNIFTLDRAQNQVAVLFTDITARKRAEIISHESEERQTFLLKLSDMLRAEQDADAVASRSIRMVWKQLRLDRCYIAANRPDEDRADILYQVGNDSVRPLPNHIRPSAFPAALQVWRDQTLVIDDIGATPGLTDEDRRNIAALGMCGVISSAVRRGEGNPLWAIVGVSAIPRRWTTAEVALAEEATERTWAAMERVRAEAALRESEGRLAAAFESMPAGVAAIDVDGRTIVANSQYRHYMPSGVIPSRDSHQGQQWQAWNEQGEVIDPHNFPGARALRGESVIPGQDMLHRDESGREIWTNVATAPTRDHAGRITGAVTVVSDIDERKRTGEALRQSEERFQQFSQASPDILWSRDAKTLQWDYLSPAFETVYGLERKEALKGNNLRRWLELVLPDDRHTVMACMRRVRKGELLTFEYRLRRPRDGQVRWIRNTDFPILDQAGRVHRIGGVGQDITELKASEAALTHSEQRLRTLVEGMSQLVWRAIDNGDWTWASPQWVAFTGQAEPDSHHLGWLNAVHPDDHEAAMAAWAQALQTGGFAVEFRIRNASDGEYRWFQTRTTPVRDAAGVVMEWLGTSTDIHELRSLQDRQKVLVAELQHRTRNLMGVVRATSESTLRESTDLVDFGILYRDRLDALARVQGLLSRLEGVERVTFDELIRSELTAIGAINGSMGKVVLNGPAGVALRSSTVQTFAMALHELATNAVKYGALASPSGHLAVTWQLEHARPEGVPWLHVDWHESGVAMPPADAPPQGTGQGRRLIEHALPYQLGARTTYVMGTDGIRCSIAVPVSSRTAAENEDERLVPPS